ncbi:MAG: hypothetical protein AAF218_06060 [Pseudomonadota bacterium]
MIIKTPQTDTGLVEDLLQSLHRSVSELRREVEDLKTQIEAGEDAGIKETKARVAGLRAMIDACQKVETHIVDCKAKRGGGGGVTLDLDAARAEIGCRLDRLARCSDT